MGSSSSKPQEKPQTKTVNENTKDTNEEIKAIPIYIHEKYEEIYFHITGQLDKPQRYIAPSDLFYIAIYFPEYCKSVHDMIRQAIRVQSLYEEKEKPDYLSNFLLSERMDYSRVQITQRCEFRSQFRISLNGKNNLAIRPKYRSNEDNIPSIDEVNFQDILNFLRCYWVVKNKNTIGSLLYNFKSISGSSSINDFTDKNRFHQIISAVLGNDLADAFVPRKNMNWKEIVSEFDRLKKKLSTQTYRCCMSFPETKPLNQITIQGKVLKHGICSNGSFLFLLTNERLLYVFLLYKGLIEKLMCRFELSEKWVLNDDTYLFCSLKWLFIKDRGITFQAPIYSMIYSDDIVIKPSTRPELSQVYRACSNGASYTLINTDFSIQTYHSENDELLLNNKSQIVSSLLMGINPAPIFISNGWFVGLLGQSGRLLNIPINSSDVPYIYPQEDNFPRFNNEDVEAATIDVLLNIYFLVSYNNSKSNIYTYQYSGSSDICTIIGKRKKVDSKDSIGSLLFNYLSSCAFSLTIPENLISSSENDIISITKWIEKNLDERELIKAMLIFLDINLKKNEFRNVAQSFLPTLLKLINDKKYKRISSVLLINNIDLFYDSLDINLLQLIKFILQHNSDSYQIYNGCIISRLFHSSILSKIDINEELLKSFLGDEWYPKSRNDKNNEWNVDLLLQIQQNMIDDALIILKEDPLNLDESKLIDSLCSFAQILINRFHLLIEHIIIDEPDITKRKIDYNSILFTLISNFVMITAPIAHCNQLALIMTSDDSQKIVQLLNDEFTHDEQLQRFIEYFDMIYTLFLSSLIRGGLTYSCEIEYSWLIHDNFKNGNRSLIPPNLHQIIDFLSSINDEFFQAFINNNNEDINNIYAKSKVYKPLKKDHEIIDRIILAAVLHQINAFDFLYDVKNHDKLKPEMNSIMKWVKKMRTDYIKACQNIENSDGINEKDRLLTNLGILIILDPSLGDYQEKNISERTQYLRLLEQFVKNNDPYKFQKILQAVPKRIDNVLCGFDRINSLFQVINNQALTRIIIDGISRVDSFERLGYLLSNAELDEHALTTLTIFCMTCIDMISNFKQLSILEILYTVLSNCKNFRAKSITVMNQLSEFVSLDHFVVDSFFMTVAGLAGSSCTLPELFYKLPEISQACIMVLIFANKNYLNSFSVSEILGFINKNNNQRIILEDVWIKMVFTMVSQCQVDEIEAVFGLLKRLFDIVSYTINKNSTVFASLPEIIYGFRHILNTGNEVSQLFQNLLSTITIDSDISDIFLLFLIIGGNIADYSTFYALRNWKGKYLKYTINDKDYCLQIPISPFSERYLFNINEINEPIQEEELNLDMSISFEAVISFANICMKDQSSILCRFYLQTLNRYISFMNCNIPKEILATFAHEAVPYINFHVISSQQTKLYMNLNNSFDSKMMLLPEEMTGFGKIQQSKYIHLFAFNIMKYPSFSLKAIVIEKAYIIIHNTNLIVIELPSGIINDTDEKIDLSDNMLDIAVLSEESTILINDKSFLTEESVSIEFVVDSIDNLAFEMDEPINFISQKAFNIFQKQENNVKYINDTFYQNDESSEDFEENLNNVKPLNFQYAITMEIEREGNNIFYNPTLEEIKFNEKLPFSGSPSTLNLICKSNEIDINNQLKSVVLAQAAINDPDSLDWPTCLSLIKSAVITVGGFNREKLFKGSFPYSLNKGFFHNISLNFLQSSNVQTLYNSLKGLLGSESFMDNLGKQLLLMARDRIYHCLIHKKDMIYIPKEKVSSFSKKENDFLIDFPDGSKGKIEIDESGNWMVNTPMVLLLLLWIYIENCSTPEQRICAKLVLVDCWLIKSPMIMQYMPEFLTYIENNLMFTPIDFNVEYIQHLSLLAAQNQKNEQIISFYEFEKSCHKLKSIKPLDIHEYPIFQIEQIKKNITPAKMIQILQLMKRYKSLEQFPVWSFVPLWKEMKKMSIKTSSKQELTNLQPNYLVVENKTEGSFLVSFTIIDGKNCSIKVCNDESLLHGKEITGETSGNTTMIFYFLNPKERKYISWKCAKAKNIYISQYQIISNDEINEENLKNDIQEFAINWTDEDTEILLSECIDSHIHCENFLWNVIDALNMTELIKKYGLSVVLCKIACVFLINSVNKLFSSLDENHMNQKDDELRSLGRKNSKFLSYSKRLNDFNIIKSSQQSYIATTISIAIISLIGNLVLNADSAIKYLTGESNNIKDSMIYQVSKPISINYNIRFKNLIWGIVFKGRESIDVSGLTNETITMATQSFLSLKTGICIISPNFINNSEVDDLSKVQVIPYPSKNDNDSINMLYVFGCILGSIIRGGINQDIPFPLFVWNFLAGKAITIEDVYENDLILKDEIEEMKKGNIKDHKWVYRDWDSSIKQISQCSNSSIVPQNLVDIYEKIVIDCRIKSIEKYLNVIRKGFWDNQNIKESNFLSGGLIKFLCHGKQSLDLQGIIKHIVFEGGNEQLINNFKTILGEYDDSMMKKFLKFTTASQKPPNFAIMPDYHITVLFKTDGILTEYPYGHTCSKSIDVPLYPTIDIMREKLNYAIEHCVEMDIA
ncbi:hypothetical protein M9Y10_007969 [Tritrichomonas musculus]|uniref:HECT-type E3 ubiquitin transferase n=1 Tax=Tritrichomonas musculus TaxID=1915356 RepID=A0ABR2J3H6_9EUKA